MKTRAAKLKDIPSEGDFYLPTVGPEETAIYLNYGWQVCADPLARGELAGLPAGEGEGWIDAPIEVSRGDGVAVHWYRRRFFLPQISLPTYRLDAAAAGGEARVFVNGTELAGANLSAAIRPLLLPGQENLLVLRVEGMDAFIVQPVKLTVARRPNAYPGFAQTSRRFAAVEPAQPEPVPFKITARAIKLRQGVLPIPLGNETARAKATARHGQDARATHGQDAHATARATGRKVRAVHYLCCVNPESSFGACNSVFGEVFGDEDNERQFLYHGQCIGSPFVPRPLVGAECHVTQATLDRSEVDTFVGLYDFVWDNVRPELPVRELLLDKYLSSQASELTVVAITLETESGPEPLELSEHFNADLDLPLPRGLVNLGFARRRLEYLSADGVPFVTAGDGKIVKFRGGRAELAGGFTGERLHLLGAIAEDTSNYGRVCKRSNAFFGDELGTIRVAYAGGGEDVFPIILGVNCWLGREWQSAIDITGTRNPSDRFAGPFYSDPQAYAALEHARMWRTVDGKPNRWGRIALQLQHKPVEKVTFTRSPDFIAEPMFSAITVECSPERGMGVSPMCSTGVPPVVVSSSFVSSLPQKEHDQQKNQQDRAGTALEHTGKMPVLHMLPQVTVDDSASGAAGPAMAPADLVGQALADRVGPLQQALYRGEATLPDNPAPDRPADYQGPDVRFAGPGRWAGMLSNTFAYALRDTVAKLVPGPDTSATSTPLAPLYGAHGIWKLNVGRGNFSIYNGYWSRDHGRTALERYELGLAGASPCEVEFTDRAAHLLCVPPHQSQEGDQIRPANYWYATTTTGQRIYGNPENDGHGLVMLMRYAHWLHSGQSHEWLERYWNGTVEAAQWICWQLDNPVRRTPGAIRKSGTRRERLVGMSQPADVLYTSSECSGYRDYEIYSNACCLFGLRAAIRMAKAAGQGKLARMWQSYADRLEAGIAKHLAVDSPFGPIWRYSKQSSWEAWCEAAGPLLVGCDLESFDASRAMSKEWLKISANTYEFLRSRFEDLIVPGHFGYGFGLFLQHALLLDRMSDASRIVENILRVNYDGRVDPWIIAELIVVRRDRKMWYRGGDHGNSVQQGEVLKGMRLMLGVDDLDADHTRLMPRLPDFCEGVEVKGYDAMVRSGESIVQADLGLSVKRVAGGWEVAAKFSAAPKKLSVRVGPFAKGARGQAKVNGRPATAKWTNSGDSAWAWVTIPSGISDFGLRIAD